MIKSAHYCDNLKLEILNKHQGKLLKGVLLLLDSAYPPTASHTVETF
jgi:hypothetical protein